MKYICINSGLVERNIFLFKVYVSYFHKHLKTSICLTNNFVSLIQTCLQLLNLLKLVISEQKKNNKAFPFDPKATIFVANRFDNIPVKDREAVKNHILEKLSASWPQFEESMTVFFSTKLAQRDITAHPHYINDNYRQLLQLFSGLYFYAMDRRLRVSYK